MLTTLNVQIVPKEEPSGTCTDSEDRQFCTYAVVEDGQHDEGQDVLAAEEDQGVDGLGHVVAGPVLQAVQLTPVPHKRDLVQTLELCSQLHIKTVID